MTEQQLELFTSKPAEEDDFPTYCRTDRLCAKCRAEQARRGPMTCCQPTIAEGRFRHGRRRFVLHGPACPEPIHRRQTWVLRP